MTDSGQQVGVVAAINRYPVKSMLGEDLSEAILEARGLVGDRLYALIDSQTGKVVSSKRPRLWSRILELRAFLDDHVRVQFPDGEEYRIEDPDLVTRLSEFFDRPVNVASSPPPGAHFDEIWLRDLMDGAEPYLGKPSWIEEGEEIVSGGTSMGRDGNFFNLEPIHIVTTSSLRALSQASPGSQFSHRRFRPNILVDTIQEGFPELHWPGHILRLGSVRLRVTKIVPRCVVTILAQDELPYDPAVLRTITATNPVDVFGNGVNYPCVGVYAEVLQQGRVHLGDPVMVE